MFTPQQIDQISFSKSTFGGYNMQQVDEFLEPLTEDYVTLYKENALLKSKMRVLVGKLEEYRKNEAAMKEKVANAQRTCDKMVMEAEAKCAKMLSSANAAAAAQAAQPVAQPVQSVPNNSALIAAENARLEDARRTASARINEIQDQMRSCIQAGSSSVSWYSRWVYICSRTLRACGHPVERAVDFTRAWLVDKSAAVRMPSRTHRAITAAAYRHEGLGALAASWSP